MCRAIRWAARRMDVDVGCGERGRSFRMALSGGANRIDSAVSAIGLTEWHHRQARTASGLASIDAVCSSLVVVYEAFRRT